MSNNTEQISEIDTILRDIAFDHNPYPDAACGDEPCNHKERLEAWKDAAVVEARAAGHRDGYMWGVSDFSNYYRDASIPASRMSIMPDIARELMDSYKGEAPTINGSYDFTHKEKGQSD